MANSISLFDDENVNKTEKRLEITGKVITTFFEGADSFYKVLLVEVEKANFDWHDTEIVVTGNFADIADDASYKFVGKLVDHPKYGQQFQADNYGKINQHSEAGLVKYLAGDDFPGIGTITAQKIVRELGTDLIDKTLANPAILNKVGLNQKQKDTIISSLQENNGTEQIIVGLNSYGFGSSLSAAIFKKYKEKSLEVIKNNPYQLVEDIKNISFKRADRIATNLGISYNAPGRLRAGLLTTLNALSIKNGNTYSNTKELMAASFEILDTDHRQNIDNQKLADELKNLVSDGKVAVDGEKIYLKQLFDDEWQIAENVKRVFAAEKKDTDNFQKIIKQVENDLDISYDESQLKAINDALQNPMFILTGGPGTGKTTIINGIVRAYAAANEISLDINKYKNDTYPILLAAPTGRAAKKMGESTGLPASTIHRLLGLNGNDEEDGNPIDGDLLIIDEMSMVDTELFTKLMKSVPSGMKVILVGDKDQLPSVGPGQVFFDLIRSQAIPKLELNQIHRQADGSTIIQLAHDIRNGLLPKSLLEKQKDRSFIHTNSGQVTTLINKIADKAIQKGFSLSDVQVLAPMYRGSSGIDNLNTNLQNIMNPKQNANQKEVKFKDIKYRIGDKVLQLVNDPENNVFNGDIGKVVGIDINKDNKHYLDKLIIAFDQTEVTYTRNEWNQITLAYCISIHKAQGSEFEMVILPIVPQYHRMLQRNLLYTAVTRAADKLVMVGDPMSFKDAVEHESSNRHTSLNERLDFVFKIDTEKQVAKKSNEEAGVSKNYTLTEQKIINNEIDPMIGMNDIKPEDFVSDN